MKNKFWIFKEKNSGCLVKFIKNFTKYVTVINIATGFIALCIGVLVKNSELAIKFLEFFLDFPTDYHTYFLSGFVTIIVKLGLKGVIEEFISEFFPEYLTINIGDIISRLFPEKSAMDLGRILNPESPPRPDKSPVNQPVSSQPAAEPLPNQVLYPPAEPLPNQVPYPDLAWVTHNYRGEGFTVKNGLVTVDNPHKIKDEEFFPSKHQPNSSPEAKKFALNIYNALSYHSYFFNESKLREPDFDKTAHKWFMRFMEHTYPDRKEADYFNSNIVRTAIQKFSKP
jgi:hypothetical protein